MSERENIIRVARGEIGLGNGTKYGAKAGEAWCSYFIRWCASQAGIRAVTIPRKPWCDDLRDYYIKDRLYHPREGYTPKIGDIVCFHWGDSGDPYAHVQHVGLVSGVDAAYVYTIEGNSGLKSLVCAGKYRRTSFSILGYCSPIYKEEAEAEQPSSVISQTLVSVCEETPTVERRPSDGSLVPSTPKSGVLSVSVRGFAARVLAGARLTQRVGSAATLTFEVLPTEAFFEGDRVVAHVGDAVVFVGYVFTKSRDEDGIIRVTAYDSLRYFKNRDTYIYENKTVSDLFLAVCRDHGLTSCRAEESAVRLPYRVEENRTLFDILSHAIWETEKKSGVRYLLCDEGGCVTLKRAAHCGAVLGETNITNFSYTSSIDGSVNRVKTITEEEGVRRITLVQNGEDIRKHGLLQTVLYHPEENAAYDLLASKLGVRRALSLTVLGDLRITAGADVTVRGVWGDVVLDHDFSVRTVTHTWDGHHHTTALTVEGGEFDA